MQTLTVEITNANALKVLQDLQEMHFINVLAKPDLNSLVFPGNPLTTEEFKEFVVNRENGASMSLKEANAKWQKRESSF